MGDPRLVGAAISLLPNFCNPSSLLSCRDNDYERPTRHLRNPTSIYCFTSSSSSSSGDYLPRKNQELSKKNEGNRGFWRQWKEKSAEMSGHLAKLGLAAVLAYGIFDGFTYTAFFVVAFIPWL